jgi:hypothetical protein
MSVALRFSVLEPLGNITPTRQCQLFPNDHRLSLCQQRWLPEAAVPGFNKLSTGWAEGWLPNFGKVTGTSDIWQRMERNYIRLVSLMHVSIAATGVLVLLCHSHYCLCDLNTSLVFWGIWSRNLKAKHVSVNDVLARCQDFISKYIMITFTSRWTLRWVTIRIFRLLRERIPYESVNACGVVVTMVP